MTSTNTATLKKLEYTLESFLQRVVALKGSRLRVLRGMNRLDDIARHSRFGVDIAEQMGEWFAEHNRLLTDEQMRPADVDRITGILGNIRRELRLSPDLSPAEQKIAAEIDRWGNADAGPRKIVLHRGPETPAPEKPVETDTITAFADMFRQLEMLLEAHRQGKQHILSVLESLLRSAKLQNNREAQMLAALIIYHLKLNGYKIQPYVKLLREAEPAFDKGVPHAE